MARIEVLNSIACNLRYYKVNKNSFIISKKKSAGEHVSEIWNVSDVSPCLFKHIYCSLWLFLLTARLYSYSPRQTTEPETAAFTQISPILPRQKTPQSFTHRLLQHIHSHSCCLSLILEGRCQKC